MLSRVHRAAAWSRAKPFWQAALLGCRRPGSQYSQQRQRGRSRLHQDDRGTGGQAAKQARCHHARQEEDPQGEGVPATEEAPGEPGGQETVVEPLVGGQHRRVAGELRRQSEDLVPYRGVPEEHLQHQESKVLEGDEGDEQVGRALS